MLKMLSNEDNNYLLSLIKENKMVEAVFFVKENKMVEAVFFVKENKMVEAVFFVKEKTGMGLKQAKEYVDTKRINDNTEHTGSNIISEADEKYIFSLLKENKQLEAIAFLHREREISLEEAKDYVDKREFKNKISNEKIPYKKGYIIDRKTNTLIRDLNRQRKFSKVVHYIILISVIISLIQLYFLDKTSLEQMLFFGLSIAFIFFLSIAWLALTLNISSLEKRMNKIEELRLELELSREFEIKSLKSNWTLLFYIVIDSLLLWVLPTHINILIEELTYKSALNVIILIILLGFCTYNFFKELKNKKYSLSISGETVKIFYENKEINSIKTDDINYIEFYKVHHRREMVDPNPILRIFDNKKEMLIEMEVTREDYHRLTMYFTNYSVLIQDKYNKI
ncbi:hypothetical protein [Treponema pedis]|uniref:hypothetical protein n=1 Tax=Treponema pedis TaxID=409322 RepID=UPI00197DED8F|nr:hypothetical protein [Treponema pedis]QSI04574.1 hypothetical protein DYQ05_06315 [Treponema pedis]